MNADDINRILDIKESYKMPEKLLKILLSENKNKIFDEFIQLNEDLNHDWFTEYFQNEHGDRDKLKQDFTPDSVCEITTELNSLKEPVLDMCSGTGGLTIKAWTKGVKNFICIEYAERAIPILLFNLAIRNVKALVFNADAITREVFNIYILTPGECYSEITTSDDKSLINFTCRSCIMNPPYSLKWDGNREFKGYPTPPKSKGDFCFLLDALERLEPGGDITAILPHGVLFRGASEGKIREKLLQNKIFDAVIGLPDKLFLNTQIPVCILNLKTDRTNSKTFFIDASREFKKERAYNVLNEEHIKKIIETFKERKRIEKYSHIASFEEIKNNDFNLNIPRYVDNFEEKTLESSIDELAADLYKTQKEILKNEREILEMCKELSTNDEILGKKLSDYVKFLKGLVVDGENYELELEEN